MLYNTKKIKKIGVIWMLKCQINTKELETVLKKLDVIRPNKNKLKILETIKLEVKEDNIKLITTDLENELKATITDYKIEHPGVIAIDNIKNILKSFKYFNAPYTEIVENENEIILLNNKKSIKIVKMDAKEYPQNIEFDTVKEALNNTPDQDNYICCWDNYEIITESEILNQTL